MNRLRISRELALPVDVAGETIAILAKRGAGKTNTGTVLVEELHRAHVQTVVVDPVGAWWGLRSSGDGKEAGLEIPILGGQHGDVPLEAAAGALIADVVVETGQSLVLDLSDFPSKTKMAQFVVDFAERLFTRKARERSLLHLVLEEADAFAPQRTFKGGERMLGAIEQIVRRGRGRGLGTTLITQRSAVLNKNVLEQADVLIVLRTTGPNDRKAIESWIEQHADEGGGHVLESLPGLETGEAWVWNPERGILKRVRIRRRHTFDSSATPKAGQRKTEPRQTAAIDLAKLGAEIEKTAERAKENDPTELRRQIRQLQKQLADRPAETIVEERVVETIVEVSVFSDQEHELLRDVGRTIAESFARAKQASEALVELLGEISNRKESHERTTGPGRAGGAVADRAGARDRPRRVPPGRLAPAARRPAAEADARGGAGEGAAGAAALGAAGLVDGEFRPSGPQRRILNALAALEVIDVAHASKVQLALFAEASPKSSSYTNNLGALRTAGLIDYPAGGHVTLTDAGRELADATDAPTSVAELQDYVARLVGGAKWRLLEQLIAVYDDEYELAKEELADRAGASATSSSFTNNLGALRSLGLITYPRPGYVAVQPVLFLEAGVRA